MYYGVLTIVRSRCMDIDQLFGMFIDQGTIAVHNHTEKIHDAIPGILLQCYSFDNFNIPLYLYLISLNLTFCMFIL